MGKKGKKEMEKEKKKPKSFVMFLNPASCRLG